MQPNIHRTQMEMEHVNCVRKSIKKRRKKETNEINREKCSRMYRLSYRYNNNKRRMKKNKKKQ